MAIMWWMMIHQPKRRRTLLRENGWKTEWLRYEDALCSTHCMRYAIWQYRVYCKKTNKTPSESARIHDVMKSSMLD